MPGMNSGLNIGDPTVVAAFKNALLHQGLTALAIFAILGLVWLTVRTGCQASRQQRRQAPPSLSPPGAGCYGSVSA